MIFKSVVVSLLRDAGSCLVRVGDAVDGNDECFGPFRSERAAERFIADHDATGEPWTGCRIERLHNPRGYVTSLFAVLAVFTATFAVLVAGPSRADAAPPVQAPAQYTYALGNGLHMYAHYDRNAVNAPWIIDIHGGYWSEGSANSTESTFCEHERALGYQCFAPEYRLVPSVRWPTPLTDVEHAIAWVRNRAALFHLDMTRGYMMGGSAGALLANIAGLDDGPFAGILCMAGVSDAYAAAFDAGQRNALLHSSALALMDNAPHTWQRWTDGRTATHAVGSYKPRWLVLHSIDDRTVNIKMSDQLVSMLRSRGYSVTYTREPGSVHSLTNLHLPEVDAWLGPAQP